MKSLIKLYYFNKNSGSLERPYLKRQKQIVSIYKILINHYFLLGIYAKLRIEKLVAGEDIEEFKDNEYEDSF